MSICLETHKYLGTKSPLYFLIKIQLPLHFRTNCPFTSEQIKNQLSIHLISLFHVASFDVIIYDTFRNVKTAMDNDKAEDGFLDLPLT